MENPTVLYRKSTKTLVKGADILEGVEYTAISHTWSMWDSVSKGILGIQQDAFCEGTANFNDMVDFVNTEWMWIDTLCISDDNKVNEIPNMRRYYKNAKVVLVVLDTWKRECNLGDLRVNDLSYRRGSKERLLLLDSSPEKITTECLPPEGVKIYETLCAMFKAEWFKRGWTLQEVLLAKDVVLWNGNSSVSVTDVRECIDWLGTVLPDVSKHSLLYDKDYNELQRIFHMDSNNISYELVDMLMGGRKCTKHEDYVYCILGLLDTAIKIEYGINLQVCKRRLFTRLVQEQKAAVVFTHTSSGVFPTHSEYGTAFNPDNPRSDRAVYSLSRKGVKFMGCNAYIYEAIGLFPTDSFSKNYPEQSLWKMTRTIGDDVSGYKDLVKAMYSSTGTDDDDEFLNTKSGWFLEMAKLSATTSVESYNVPVNFDCLLLHLLLTEPDTPLVSFGMVHNNVAVCAYVFACLEAVPRGGKCLLLAPGIIGEVRETGILCSGLNPKKNRQQKIGATLNLSKDGLGSIDPIANLLKVVVTDRRTCFGRSCFG